MKFAIFYAVREALGQTCNWDVYTFDENGLRHDQVVGLINLQTSLIAISWLLTLE